MIDFHIRKYTTHEYPSITCTWKNNEGLSYRDFSQLIIIPNLVKNPMSISYRGYSLKFKGRNSDTIIKLSKMFSSFLELECVAELYCKTFDLLDKFEMEDVV